MSSTYIPQLAAGTFGCTIKRRSTGEYWQVFVEAPTIAAAATRVEAIVGRDFSKIIKIEMVGDDGTVPCIDTRNHR